MSSPSTVGRGKRVTLGPGSRTSYTHSRVSLHLGDALEYYERWETPTAIISDGAYGILGFEGDTAGATGLPEWYEPHVWQWSERATSNTTLWFWNSEIGWATTHSLLEKYGWRYVNANIWDKGIGHIAGNVNTQKIRRFPVVTEVCVQYAFQATIRGIPLKEWLRSEWLRTGLPLSQANAACGVKDAAVRKYLDQGHLWYMPPTETMLKLSAFADLHGRLEGKPYYSIDGTSPLTEFQWAQMRTKFKCPHGVTNCWSRPSLKGPERIKFEGRAVHLNQKPLDLMERIIEASTDVNDVVWEPFGGLFSGSLAAAKLGRKGLGAEIDPTYFEFGVRRCAEVLGSLSTP